VTRIEPLLERNARIAAGYTPAPLAPPTAQAVILSCLDHRLPPEVFLGMDSGEAPVIRNAGGRVTSSVIQDIAFLAFLADEVFGGAAAPDASLFEVAVIHHTQCGTGFLGDAAFRRQAARTTGLSEEALASSVVVDPFTTVREDVDRLLAAAQISVKVSVSGHVYDLDTGRLTTVVDARFPLAEHTGGLRTSAALHRWGPGAAVRGGGRACGGQPCYVRPWRFTTAYMYMSLRVSPTRCQARRRPSRW
jgi:carbonic anhydrase